MSHPATPSRFNGTTLLAWCGYAALAGLFTGIAIGAAILLR